MSEFKLHPYIYFYPKDWLMKPEVRILKPEVKGFYIDLICQLHLSFPYGYCSILNPLNFNKLQKQLYQKQKQNDKQTDELLVHLLLSLSVSEQLKLAQNIEPVLSKYLPYTQAEIALYINELLSNNIISRSSDGIIFVRRMVKDFKRRVVAHLNGSKNINAKQNGVKIAQKNYKKNKNNLLNNNELQNLLQQNDKQHGVATSDTIKDINNNIFRKEGESVREETVYPFRMQELYDKTFEQLQQLKYSRTLTAEGFEKWKGFVDWVIQKEYSQLFISEFIKPPDFEKIYRAGFTEEKWDDVIMLILSSGVQHHHNLHFRIPQFLKDYEFKKSKTNHNGHTTKQTGKPAGYIQPEVVSGPETWGRTKPGATNGSKS